MSCNNRLAELIPFYAADTLDDSERLAVEAHLAVCADCQAELALWADVGAAIAEENVAIGAPPVSLVESALAVACATAPAPWERAWQLLRPQVKLLRREIWLASALVMAIGYFVAVFGASEQAATSALEVVAPFVAAAGVALIYGTESDPALEITLATPTSPRQVLLARLALVFGYDLALSLLATVGLLAVVPVDLLSGIILNWLGPMTLLSALALLLSVSIGTGNAITAASMLWLSRWIAHGQLGRSSHRVELGSSIISLGAVYDSLWSNTFALMIAAAVLTIVALLIVGRQEHFLLRPN